MPRTPVPTEFKSTGPVASPEQVKYICDLLDQKDLFKDPRWFDAVNAMDAAEYAAHIECIKEQVKTVAPKRASEIIDSLKALPYKPREEQPHTNRSMPSPEELPAGRYAVESEEGELRFYRLWRGTRKPEYVKLYVLHGPDSSEIPFKSVRTILNKIVAAGARECAIRFGREIGACSVCGTRLTSTLSRELGIGPVCGGRWFADEWSSVRSEARESILARGEDPDAEVE